jgi:hypothetical protein
VIDPPEHGGVFMHMHPGHFRGNLIGPGVSLAVRGGERRHQRSKAGNRLESFHLVIPKSLPARRGFIGLWSESPRSSPPSRTPFVGRQIVFWFCLLLTSRQLQTIWSRPEQARRILKLPHGEWFF